MERIAPTPPPDLQVRPQQPEANSSGAKAMPSALTGVSAREDGAQGKLQVELDADAGRFVQTLTDASNETIWQYPNEAQLAYSRAVMAYMRALANS